MKKIISLGAPVSRKNQMSISGGLAASTSCKITSPDGKVRIVRFCNCAVILLLPGYTCETI
jgi:hypothetical protein